MRTFTDWLRGYGLEPKDVKLYYEACTHSSYANEHHHSIPDNERLEFMGDAVLQIWSAEALYNIHPKLPEGKMTTIRAQTVCESTLARLNDQLGWYEFLRLGVGEEKSGGRHRTSILADQFEACIGAVYLDLGYEAVEKILNEYMKPLISATHKPEDVTDYKTQLQEFVQTDNRKTIQYRLLSETGPSNAPTFKMGVFLDEICMGVGSSSTKKRAEQKAAKEAFAKLAK
ncbi:ribonuclease III [Ileibacterium valens]|uniref:Ribonuclease 3 n=2 Tax=Ileibacterium valens TaxID=1862668 RepID=A0A1U7NCY2_9FIRM|nr:ribonuclease III [Ileibacterium valens]OLU36712.1 ribonuclease III [Ileibacterium valens]OLU39030.1 ribonuclease III [Erysipelotrichaceae bacterium NYU-BL-F16]OLU41205.1 ribonuclease III [Erysipelotrichaceae bacterium NYU-BL-E8]